MIQQQEDDCSAVKMKVVDSRTAKFRPICQNNWTYYNYLPTHGPISLSMLGLGSIFNLLCYYFRFLGRIVHDMDVKILQYFELIFTLNSKFCIEIIFTTENNLVFNL